MLEAVLYCLQCMSRPVVAPILSEGVWCFNVKLIPLEASTSMSNTIYITDLALQSCPLSVYS